MRNFLSCSAEGCRCWSAAIIAPLRHSCLWTFHRPVWVSAWKPPSFLETGRACPNRLVLRDTVEVGELLEIAVFAIKGPISAAPANFL